MVILAVRKMCGETCWKWPCYSCVKNKNGQMVRLVENDPAILTWNRRVLRFVENDHVILAVRNCEKYVWWDLLKMTMLFLLWKRYMLRFVQNDNGLFIY